ncbi:helix-turn-helix domain-containing protein [Paenibacillus sp. WQ 127069]|uniref:Helix-turn-helix domain-containing protein n=1 Tax=Paenibacillus baimaensis TaxID=2982185 RepID=A0ABT2U9P3_9BACL|nr:helix-turn-helix domain-containing protein [Paenibacillus sp. WQ 127069]MCU6791358.1 helix-turn-helix domain-containing protein [Paenibacillus sp. WQ 127069]
MYKVMLVDDDFPVLEYLQKVIPWDSLNLQLIGRFDNGQKAHNKAMTEMPDILITDIGMPVMDGLKLIDSLTAQKDNLRSVILSCHDEFAFAMHAIKLNVVEYILKETLDPQMLIEILQKIIHNLDEDHKIKQQIQEAASFANDKNNRLKKEWISSLMNNPLLDEDTWVQQAGSIGLDFQDNSYIPVLCYINRYHDAQKRYITDHLISFLVQNVIEEIVAMENNQGILQFTYNGKETVLLFPIQDFLKTNVYETMNRILETINTSLTMYLKFSITVLVGQIARNSLELKSYMKQLLEYNEHSFYLEEGSIIKLPSVTYSFSREDLFAKYIEATQQFQDIILRENETDLKDALDQWIYTLGQEKYRPRVIKEWGLKILLDLRVKIKSLLHFETKFSEEVVHQNLLHAETIEHFKDMMWDNLSELLQVIHNVNASSKRYEIIEAQRYILHHLHQKITLSEIADHLNLNAAYFSRLFKKETNENFVDHVIRLKMEKACEYLDHSSKNMEQISELLGFDSKSYFIRTFKKITGMLPSDYKHRLRDNSAL